jgi:hypothetical protein
MGDFGVVMLLQYGGSGQVLRQATAEEWRKSAEAAASYSTGEWAAFEDADGTWVHVVGGPPKQVTDGDVINLIYEARDVGDEELEQLAKATTNGNRDARKRVTALVLDRRVAAELDRP